MGLFESIFRNLNASERLERRLVQTKQLLPNPFGRRLGRLTFAFGPRIRRLRFDRRRAALRTMQSRAPHRLPSRTSKLLRRKDESLTE